MSEEQPRTDWCTQAFELAKELEAERQMRGAETVRADAWRASAEREKGRAEMAERDAQFVRRTLDDAAAELVAAEDAASQQRDRAKKAEARAEAAERDRDIAQKGQASTGVWMERDALRAKVAELEAELDRLVPEPAHCLGGGGRFD